MDQEILISLCIPTYNRVSYLEKSLKSIVSQPEFNDSIEVVIADNCSTDGTFELIRELQQKFPNIRYFRNDKNIGMEENFAKVLSLGRGKFLKLVNDYSMFKEHSILYLRETVLRNIGLKPVLFYSNGELKLEGDTVQVKNIDEFIKCASYWVTWISCFGIWKEDFDGLEDKESLIGLMFFHTALLFKNTIQKNKVIIFDAKLFEVLDVKAKGGYHLFEVFINGYLENLLLGLLKNKELSKRTYRTEKAKFLRRFLLKWYLKTFNNKNADGFTSKNAFRLIYKTYKYELCFYLELPFLFINIIRQKLRGFAT